MTIQDILVRAYLNGANPSSPGCDESVEKGKQDIIHIFEGMKKDELCTCGDKYKCGCGKKQYNQALTDVMEKCKS